MTYETAIRAPYDYANALPDDAAIDPTTVAFFIRPPGQPVTTIVYPGDQITRQAEGLYTLDQDCDTPSVWRWGTQSTGTGQAAGEARSS